MSHLPAWFLFAYTLPMVGSGAMDLFFEAFSLKFCTDTLLISPGTMGSIFSLGRVWDAVSDPLAGYLSDRTSSELGRRRLWVLVSAAPLGLSFAAVFAPPMALVARGLLGWQTAAILCYYTSTTSFKVPHTCLGVEVSQAAPSHERSRIFAYRSGVTYLGALLGTVMSVVAFGKVDLADRRAMVAICTLPLGLLTALLQAVSVPCLTEPFAARTTGADVATARSRLPGLRRVVSDVWLNPHARVLTLVLFIEDGSRSAFALVGPYAIQYVALLPPLWVSLIILIYLLATMGSIPVWHHLGRKYGKVRVWRVAMLQTAFGFVTTLAIMHPSYNRSSFPARTAYVALSATLIGTATGAGTMLGAWQDSNPTPKHTLISSPPLQPSFFSHPMPLRVLSSRYVDQGRRRRLRRKCHG